MVKIYILKDPVTMNIRYVGKTERTLARRLHNHCQCNHNPHKQRWIAKLKRLRLKPVIELIEECEDDKWVEREMYWINHYGKTCNLLNYTEGGEVGNKKNHNVGKLIESRIGSKLSEEHKLAISRANKGKEKSVRMRELLRQSRLGKKASEETRRRLSEAHKGQIRTPEAIEKARLKLIGKKKTEETKRKISESHKGKKNSKVHNENTRKAIIKLQGRPVLQYTLDGNFLREWEASSVAADYYKVDRSSLMRCCQGKFKSSCGYKWKYKNEDIV